MGGRVAWCSRCGAFGESRSRNLSSVCPKGPGNRHTAGILKQLKAGTNPSTKSYVGRSVPLVWSTQGWVSMGQP
eukprot:5036044-Pyramimonas_sp.AAC.1